MDRLMLANKPFVSIIVPFYQARDCLVKECVQKCLELAYPNFEIIVVSNTPVKFENTTVRVIVTPAVSQGEKNDIGTAAAKGEICAFIGDDAYPSRDWLANGVTYFQDPEIAAVEGPALTPETDSLLQKASGVVYASFFGGGNAWFRNTPAPARPVDDCSATNLLVRKSVLCQVGGFSGFDLRSGEDSYLAMKIRGSGLKILYVPDAIVYHHRRRLFVPHAKQVWNRAVHRGYFARRNWGTSRSPIFFLPSAMLVCGSAYLVLVATNTGLIVPSIFAFSTFFLLAFVSSWAIAREFEVALVAPLGIILTHLSYGLGFIYGLLFVPESSLRYKD